LGLREKGTRRKREVSREVPAPVLVPIPVPMVAAFAPDGANLLKTVRKYNSLPGEDFRKFR